MPTHCIQTNGWKLADFGMSKNLAWLISEKTFRQAGTPCIDPEPAKRPTVKELKDKIDEIRT